MGGNAASIDPKFSERPRIDFPVFTDRVYTSIRAGARAYRKRCSWDGGAGRCEAIT